MAFPTMDFIQVISGRRNNGLILLLVSYFIINFSSAFFAEAFETSEDISSLDYDYVDGNLAIPYDVGGSHAGRGDFPHQVALYKIQSNTPFCSGSIISPDLILTAAHCLKYTWPSCFKVIAGAINLNLEEEENEQAMSVRSVYIHEKYDERILANDIGIIKLNSTLQYNRFVTNVNLPRENEKFEAFLTVTGWCTTKHNKTNSFSKKLKMAKMNVVGNENCKISNKNENQFCVQEKTVNTCVGDNGSPAITKFFNTSTWALRGVVSCGVQGCGMEGAPLILTRVAGYYDWIMSTKKKILKEERVLAKLVRNGINLKNGNLETPLHRAAVSSDKAFAIRSILYLIENGTDVHAMDEESYTFLHRLVDDWTNINPKQFHEIVGLLISRNLSHLFNVKDKLHGTTPLMLSVANVDLTGETLFLLNGNVNFTLLDKNGKSALFYAAEGSSNQKLVAGILGLKATKLSDAIDVMDEKSVKLLLRLGAKANGSSENMEDLLHLAAASKNKTFAINAIKLLMENGANASATDGEGQTFHHKLLSNGTTLTQSGFINIAQLLVSSGSCSLLTQHCEYKGQRPRNCEDIQIACTKTSGIYTIFPFDSKKDVSVEVYCDLQTDGGGWTVFQRRRPPISATVDFERSWQEYAEGFHGSSMADSHWLGLNIISELTKAGDSTLRIDMTDWDNTARFAEYSSFKVDNEAERFKLTVKGFRGDAGDSLNYHNGMYFSTKDRDNDENDGFDCALYWRGAWWYNSCHDSGLNGIYRENGRNAGYGNIYWNSWHGSSYSLKTTEMKFRSKTFKGTENCNEG